MLRLSIAAAVVLALFSTHFGNAQAQPAAPPSLAFQHAQADVDKMATAAAKAYVDYRKICRKGATESVRNAAVQTLLRANSSLDVYIREEALLSPDVNEASHKSDDAAMAELRARSKPHATAASLAAAHNAKVDSYERAERLFHKRMAAIRKRLTRNGYAFGIPEGRCRG